MPGHRAQSRVRCTHSEPWRKGKRDPRSVPAATPTCPDNRRKFRVHGRKSVVSQNIMITLLLYSWTRFFSHVSIPSTSMLYKAEGTQNKIICYVSKHNYRCAAAVEPLFPLPTCPCTKKITVYRKYVVCQDIITAVPVLLWQAAVTL